MIVQEVFKVKQATVMYSLTELVEMMQQDRISMREPNVLQVRAIRKYIVDNVLSKDIYLPPLVAAGELTHEKPSALRIIDGVNVLSALTSLTKTVLNMIQSEDDEEKRRGFALDYALDEVKIAFQVFDGLTEEQMVQLYIDLNSKGKQVSLSKRIAYDSRNIINIVTNDLLMNDKQLQLAGVEQEKLVIKRPNNKKLLSLSQLRSLVCLFMTGKMEATKVVNVHINESLVDERLPLLKGWLDELFALYEPLKIGNYHESMLASFTVLQAVAHYALEGIEQVSEPVRHIQQRMQALKAVNWSRNQEVWHQFAGTTKGKEKYYYIHNTKSNVQAIVNWLNLQGGDQDVKR